MPGLSSPSPFNVFSSVGFVFWWFSPHLSLNILCAGSLLTPNTQVPFPIQRALGSWAWGRALYNSEGWHSEGQEICWRWRKLELLGVDTLASSFITRICHILSPQNTRCSHIHRCPEAFRLLPTESSLRVEGVGPLIYNEESTTIRVWLLELKTVQSLHWGPVKDVSSLKGCSFPTALQSFVPHYHLTLFLLLPGQHAHMSTLAYFFKK